MAQTLFQTLGHEGTSRGSDLTDLGTGPRRIRGTRMAQGQALGGFAGNQTHRRIPGLGNDFIRSVIRSDLPIGIENILQQGFR